jgi:hypothetical protein
MSRWECHSPLVGEIPLHKENLSTRQCTIVDNDFPHVVAPWDSGCWVDIEQIGCVSRQNCITVVPRGSGRSVYIPNDVCRSRATIAVDERGDVPSSNREHSRASCTIKHKSSSSTSIQTEEIEVAPIVKPARSGVCIRTLLNKEYVSRCEGSEREKPSLIGSKREVRSRLQHLSGCEPQSWTSVLDIRLDGWSASRSGLTHVECVG